MSKLENLIMKMLSREVFKTCKDKNKSQNIGYDRWQMPNKWQGTNGERFQFGCKYSVSTIHMEKIKVKGKVSAQPKFQEDYSQLKTIIRDDTLCFSFKLSIVGSICN